MQLPLSSMSSLASTTQNSSSLIFTLMLTSTLRVADSSKMLTTSMDLRLTPNLITTSTNHRLSLGTHCMLSTP